MFPLVKGEGGLQRDEVLVHNDQSVDAQIGRGAKLGGEEGFRQIFRPHREKPVGENRSVQLADPDFFGIFGIEKIDGAKVERVAEAEEGFLVLAAPVFGAALGLVGLPKLLQFCQRQAVGGQSHQQGAVFQALQILFGIFNGILRPSGKGGEEKQGGGEIFHKKKK